MAKKIAKKTDRNAKCPCKSGLLYKNCCMKKASAGMSVIGPVSSPGASRGAGRGLSAPLGGASDSLSSSDMMASFRPQIGHIRNRAPFSDEGQALLGTLVLGYDELYSSPRARNADALACDH